MLSRFCIVVLLSAAAAEDLLAAAAAEDPFHSGGEAGSVVHKIKSFVKQHLPGHHAGGQAGDVEEQEDLDVQSENQEQPSPPLKKNWTHHAGGQAGDVEEQEEVDVQSENQEQTFHSGAESGSVSSGQALAAETSAMDQSALAASQLQQLQQYQKQLDQQRQQQIVEQQQLIQERAYLESRGQSQQQLQQQLLQQQNQNQQQFQQQNDQSQQYQQQQPADNKLVSHAGGMAGSVVASQEAEENQVVQNEAEVSEQVAEEVEETENSQLRNLIQGLHDVTAEAIDGIKQKASPKHHAGGMAGEGAADAALSEEELEDENTNLMNVIKNLHGMLGKHVGAGDDAATTAGDDVIGDVDGAEVDKEVQSVQNAALPPAISGTSKFHAGGVSGSVEGKQQQQSKVELSEEELETENAQLQTVIKELHDMLGKTFGMKK